MIVRILTLALMGISLLMFSCGRQVSAGSGSSEEKTGSMARALELAGEMYPEASVMPNPANDYAYALSTKKTAPKSLLKGVHFFVYSVKGDTIIHQDVLPLGKIMWSDTYLLRVEKYPGETDPDVEPDMGYILDVQTGNKSEI